MPDERRNKVYQTFKIHLYETITLSSVPDYRNSFSDPIQCPGLRACKGWLRISSSKAIFCAPGCPGSCAHSFSILWGCPLLRRCACRLSSGLPECKSILLSRETLEALEEMLLIQKAHRMVSFLFLSPYRRRTHDHLQMLRAGEEGFLHSNP